MKEKVWINGTSDIMFKTLLRNNRRYLSYIVSKITGIEESIIYNSLKYSPVEFKIENKNEKKKISDLIIEIDMHIINLEMNKKMNESIKNRNTAYIDKINIEQYKDKKDYKNSKKVIQINFNEQKYEGEKIVYKFKMMEEELKLAYEDNKEIYVVDLEKIKNKCYNRLEMNEFEKALSLLVSRNKEEAKELSRGNDMLEEVFNNMEELNMNEVFLGMYDEEEENKKMMNSMKLEGLEEGIEQGIEQGLKTGEKNKAIKIAKNMINKNIDINVISEVTGLTIEEIENLK